MTRANILTYFSAIILEFLAKILYFPVWWYSIGLIKKIKSLFYFLKNREQELGFFIWFKNIFVPMYGQRDFTGRTISFFIRFFQIIFRFLVLFFWFLISIVMLLLWLFFPIMLAFALIFQIF